MCIRDRACPSRGLGSGWSLSRSGWMIIRLEAGSGLLPGQVLLQVPDVLLLKVLLEFWSRRAQARCGSGPVPVEVWVGACSGTCPAQGPRRIAAHHPARVLLGKGPGEVRVGAGPARSACSGLVFVGAGQCPGSMAVLVEVGAGHVCGRGQSMSGPGCIGAAKVRVGAALCAGHGGASPAPGRGWSRLRSRARALFRAA